MIICQGTGEIYRIQLHFSLNLAQNLKTIRYEEIFTKCLHCYRLLYLYRLKEKKFSISKRLTNVFFTCLGNFLLEKSKYLVGVSKATSFFYPELQPVLFIKMKPIHSVFPVNHVWKIL